MNRGFSLIETIIYIALLGLLMVGAIVTSYEITQNSFLVDTRNTTQEEGDFVIRKLEAAFVGAEDLVVNGSTLTIDRYSGSNIVFSVSGGAVTINRGGGADPITTNNVTVDSFVLTLIPGPPKGVEVTLTLDGVPFILTKYVRE